MSTETPISRTVTFEEMLERDGRLIYTNRGVSMLPLLRAGRDLMVIEKKKPPFRRFDVVLFTRPGVSGYGAYVLHRILRDNRDGTYWIVGDNCFSGETVQEKNILGLLTGVVRDGKEMELTDPWYRLYVNTWCRCWRIRFLILRAKRTCRAALRRVYRMVKRAFS